MPATAIFTQRGKGLRACTAKSAVPNVTLSTPWFRSAATVMRHQNHTTPSYWLSSPTAWIVTWTFTIFRWNQASKTSNLLNTDGPHRYGEARFFWNKQWSTSWCLLLVKPVTCYNYRTARHYYRNPSLDLKCSEDRYNPIGYDIWSVYNSVITGNWPLVETPYVPAVCNIFKKAREFSQVVLNHSRGLCFFC